MMWRRKCEKAKGISFADVNRFMKDKILVLAPIVASSYLKQQLLYSTASNSKQAPLTLEQPHPTVWQWKNSCPFNLEFVPLPRFFYIRLIIQYIIKIICFLQLARVNYLISTEPYLIQLLQTADTQRNKNLELLQHSQMATVTQHYMLMCQVLRYFDYCLWSPETEYNKSNTLVSCVASAINHF